MFLNIVCMTFPVLLLYLALMDTAIRLAYRPNFRGLLGPDIPLLLVWLYLGSLLISVPAFFLSKLRQVKEAGVSLWIGTFLALLCFAIARKIW